VSDAAPPRTLARVLAGLVGARAEAAAAALGSVGPAAEGPLVEALAHRLDFVRAAAARALARAGTAAAVLPLREAEARHPRDAAFRRAAREAVVAIQARTGGATPGRLSLAADEPGKLSLATEEGGRVSFPGRR
jgi:HEAT repeat protein